MASAVSETNSDSAATTVAPLRADEPSGGADGWASRPIPLLRGWFHGGALVAVLIAGPILAAHGRTTSEHLALAIYVFSLAALFGVSTAFHRIRWSRDAHRRIRRIDHVTIFLAIAGTYTAISCLVLHGWAEALALGIVWGGAVGGVVLRQCWLDAPKWAVALPYVVVGWSALAVAPQLVAGLGGAGFALLIVGGAAYTAGSIVYARKRPNLVPGIFGFHELFHACTVVGATIQFVVVAAYALPRS